MLRATNAEIRLQNIAHNIQVIRAGLKPETKFLAVVKANAYGHGIEEVAGFLQHCGVDYLGVAIAEEGAELRKSGITLPILILGASMDTHLDCIVENDLIPTVFSSHTLQQLQATAARFNKVCRIHFKIDSGMNRIGFTDKDDFRSALGLLRDCPNLVLDGMFTHFAVSELPDPSFTLQQAERFYEYVDIAHAAGYYPILHAANSGAALALPRLQFDMVRGGIAMYGYHPAGAPVRGIDLRPVMSWKTNIVNIKTIDAGESVSYGRRFIADRPTVVATLPVGYGDGFKRCLTGHAEVLIHGQRAPLIGTVCMDQCMCDVTHIKNAAIGDEVILMGQQGDESITADELAAHADTISYEILLSVSKRVPRIYLTDESSQQSHR